MNAGSPSAVVPGSCLSLSSTSKFSVRQARAPTVCFHSVLSPCRCVLPLSTAAGNSSFLHTSHGRRKPSKAVLVVKGSTTTFELKEESKVQGLQESARARGEPTVRGRVSWSADGKPTILWGTPKPRDEGAERQSNGGHSFKEKEAELEGKSDAHHGTHVPSADEHRDFLAPKNRPSAAHSGDTIAIPKRPSTRHSEIFSPSSASRLLTGSPAPKQIAETQALTSSPISPVRRARTPLTRNENTQFQGGAPAHAIPLRKEDDHQGGPVFKSRLEEILNEFRNRQQREERGKDKKARQNNVEDIYKERGLSSPGSTSPASRRETTSSTLLSWKSARRDNQDTDYDLEDISQEGGLSPPGYMSRVSKRETTSKTSLSWKSARRDNQNTDYDLEDTSKEGGLSSPGSTSPVSRREKTSNTSSSWKSARRDNQNTDYDLEDISKEGGLSSPGSTSGFSRRQTTSNTSISWKSARRDNQNTDYGGMNDANFSNENFDAVEDHGKESNEKGVFMTRHRNRAHIKTDHEPLDPPNTSLRTPQRSRRGLSPVMEKHSFIRNRNPTSLKGHAAEHKPIQNNSSKSHTKSMGKVWVNDKKGSLASRNEATERPYKDGMNHQPQFQMSGCNKVNFDEEGSDNTAFRNASDFEDDSIQNKDSTAGLKTIKKKSLVVNGKATWHSQSKSSLPFEYQFSYSEVPNAPILRYREKPFSPFGPHTMSRPWTGGPPLKKNKRNVPLFDSFNPPPKDKKGVKYVQDPGPYRPGQGPKPSKTRDEILGEPLTTEEIAMLIDSCQEEKRQLNLGRDGLTHNMLDLIHCHWKRRRVIKVRCMGVPTIDMDNVCFHLEDKTGGKIIYCHGGIVYLFRGRNYNYKDRPEIPLMLWKPISPVYPRLIQRAPEGLTEEEAEQLRELGKKVEPLCRLNKNGIYYKLADDVRVAFKVDRLVRIDCRGLNPSDYKKIGAKLKDLVPCVLLSFDNEQILMWKGKETSTDPGSLKESAAEGTTEESLANDMVPVPKRDLEDIKAGFTGVSGHIYRAEQIKDNITPEGYVGTELSSKSEVTRYWHKDFGVQCEQDLYDPNLLFQDTQLQIHSTTAPERMVDNAGVLPDDTWLETGSYSESPFWTGGQENQTAPLQVIGGLQSSETSLRNMRSVGAAEKDSSDTHSAAYFDDLWEEAITSGIAVQLDPAEMDNDTVVTRARNLAAEVPAGEEYTRKLIKSLEIKAPRIAQPSQQLHKHLRRIKKMKLERKLLKQRSFRNRPDFKDFRRDGQGPDGMHVDELAQLLSMR